MIELDGVILLKSDGLSVYANSISSNLKLFGNRSSNRVRYFDFIPANDLAYRINDTLTVTGDQLFLHPQGYWVAINPSLAKQEYPDLEIHDLTTGDYVLTIGGAKEVESIKPVRPDGNFLALDLTGNKVFIANGYYVHNGGRRGGGGGGTTIQKTEPPAYLKPYLIDVADKAKSAMDKMPQGGFGGQLVATPTQAQRDAIDLQQDLAYSLTDAGQGTQAIADTQRQKFLTGGFTARADKEFTPEVLDTQPAIEAMLNPIQQRLEEQVIPNLRSEAITQGAYGGDRYWTAADTAIRDNFTREAQDIAAKINLAEGQRRDDARLQSFLTNQSLYSDLQRQEQAASALIPNLQQSVYQEKLMPSEILNRSGTQEQLFNQDLLDEAYQQYVLSTQTPFAGLDSYASLINSIPMGGMSTLTGPRQRGGGRLGGAIAGGLGGAGAAAALGLTGPAGWALAGLGALGGLL